MAMNWRHRRLAAVCALGLCAVACTTVQTTAPGAVGVDRKQRMFVSEEEVEKGAQQAYAQEVQQAQTSGKLNTNTQLTARVRHVAQRLIPETKVFRPDAPQWKWEINTLQTD